MCVGGCIPALSVWMYVCVWGGRRRRARAQLHALGRGQRDQPCQSSITSDELSLFQSFHWGREGWGEKEGEETARRGIWTGREGGETEKAKKAGWRQRSASEVWAAEWQRSRWKRRGEASVKWSVSFSPLCSSRALSWSPTCCRGGLRGQYTSTEAPVRLSDSFRHPYPHIFPMSELGALYPIVPLTYQNADIRHSHSLYKALQSRVWTSPFILLFSVFCMKTCDVINDYHVSLLSLMASFSLHLSVWPFGTAINIFAYWCGQMIHHTNFSHIIWYLQVLLECAA